MSSNTNRDWPAIGRHIGYILGFGVVAGIAAWASYWHQVDLATLAHQPAKLAYALPLSVDGMLVVGAMAMADDLATGRKSRGWARFAFWLGATVSTAANITSTAVHYGDFISVAVSAWAPVCFLVSVEIIRKKGKPQTGTAATPTVRVTPEPVVQAAEVVSAEVTRLPVPVSPAAAVFREPDEDDDEPSRSWSGPERVVSSPLTGRVLIPRRPKK